MPIYNSICKPVNPKFYDTSNSLTSGLVFDAQLYEGAGTTALDLAGNVSGSFSGSGGPTWGSRNPYGKIVTFTDNTDIDVYTSISSQNSLANISVEALIYPTAINAANDSRYIHKGNSTKYFAVGTTNSGGNKINIQIEFPTTEVSVLSDVITLSTWIHVVTTFTPSDATGTSAKIYTNSILNTGSIPSTGTGTAPADTTELFIGNRGSAYGSTKGFVGDIAYVRIWNRIITQTEVTNLYSNPWRIYARPSAFTTLRPRPFGPGLAR